MRKKIIETDPPMHQKHHQGEEGVRLLLSGKKCRSYIFGLMSLSNHYASFFFFFNSNNPFISSQSQKSRKRQRRPKMPILDENDEVERSRYLEEFEESEQLGSGNFCVTYKCRNRLDGKSYAIKRARKRMHGDADKRRMLREVFALSALVDVPNIVQYHTAWIEDDRLYIQLGYCNGGTIQDIMRSGLSKSKTNAGVEAEKVLEEPVALNGRLTTYGALQLMIQVGNGLKEMHGRGMVHMDVKPDNILVPDKSKATFCLGDLGMATKRCLGRSDVLQEGDDRYMAKEFMDDVIRPRDLAPTDIFSFGVSIYHLLRGLSEPPRDEYHSIRDGKLCLPQEINPEVRDLLTAMVHPDAKKRPSAEEIVNQSKLLMDSIFKSDSSSNTNKNTPSLDHFGNAAVDSGTITASQGKSGTMDGRGGHMFKAATSEIIESLRQELEKERALRRKAEEALASAMSTNADEL